MASGATSKRCDVGAEVHPGRAGPDVRGPTAAVPTGAACGIIKAEHDFDVNVLALRTLAELLGDVHDPQAQQNLKTRIEELLGDDPAAAATPSSR